MGLQTRRWIRRLRIGLQAEFSLIQALRNTFRRTAVTHNPSVVDEVMADVIPEARPISAEDVLAAPYPLPIAGKKVKKSM